MQAQNLKEALANLNEQSSLIFEKLKDIPASASSEFYVGRPDNPMGELETFIINSPSDDKILFTGHLGSGKSTELNRFAFLPEIQKHFFVIKYSISEALNIIDIDYIDFLLSFAATLFIKASEAQITFNNAILSVIEKWVSYFKGDVTEFAELDQGKSKIERIVHFFTNISTILLRELALRDKVRETIGHNITQLVNVINALVAHVRSNLPDGKELLIIIDDLEKIPDVNRADRLFNEAGTYMTTPKCKIIYTVPIALYYSLRFQQLANIFGNHYFLPNIKIKERDNSGQIDPLGCMSEFLRKRMNESLIDPDAKEIAIENSAGVAREFVRILKNSCVKALTKNRETISRDIVADVIVDLRNEYSRGLEKRHIDVLRAIAKNEPVEDHETHMELFHSKVILEYRNGEKWTAINPIVQPLLTNRM
jgi:hypothetical protein